jgi:hypothetical protein
MNAKKDLDKIFYELVNRYVIVIERNYHWRYKRANDKEFIKNELKQGTELMAESTFFDDGQKEILRIFLDYYKRGEDINETIRHLRDMFSNIDGEKPYRLIENGEAITLYLSEEEKALKKLALDERKLMKLVITNTAYREIQKRLPTMFEEPTSVKDDKETTVKYPVKWTGKKDNKNEFVQLLYALHKAGFINEGKGEITKITEALAETFDISLGKGWQGNHSSSIHKANRNYQPPIFHKIQETYKRYTDELIEDKKKN